ncbi:metal ABC transporter permease [Oceanospirillum sediminis]|uniref:Metal ABC transporter permease n=1 Tax=Oceanospirillum sediminis TaxID=2760088 RepID=A0A839ISP5_9GAMM|nr:metal ABC transporter permease [Oceanospirillum sediminis]MBB1487196.1 metal ABC transporter permease [Oceanospirillum sediminis]
MPEWVVLNLLTEPFAEFSFMRRALAGCLILSLSAAPVGVFLMLRRMSLIGDAMAHAILPGAAIGFMMAGLSVGAMTVGGLLAGCLVAVLSGLVARATVTGEDSSMAAFYLISLALGVLIISVNGSNVDLLHVLFGSTLALNDAALQLLAIIAACTVFVLLVLYRPLVMECVDPEFFRSVSGLSALAHFSFLGLVVLNLVAGFHALGTMMAVGLMILPGAAARFWGKRLESLLLLSVTLAALASLAGLLASYYVNWPTSPLIILSLGGFYLLSLLLGKEGGLIFRFISLKHLEN